jgi:hypothetical protein
MQNGDAALDNACTSPHELAGGDRRGYIRGPAALNGEDGAIVLSNDARAATICACLQPPSIDSMLPAAAFL